MKKISRYNRYIIVDNEAFVYNLLSRSLICIGDESVCHQLKDGVLTTFDEKTIKLLYDNKILCDESIDESLNIVRIQRFIKYGNKNARITLLPTLNCNFKCWYCYEDHVARTMSENESDAVYKFCQNIVSTNRLNSLTLDWFGGEPMLQFNRIIVPLSKKVRQLCIENQIAYYNMITTNGVLITKEFLDEIREIELGKFQITLDGGKEYHNKTRYSKKHPNSYQSIIDTINMLVSEIPDIDLTLRINCTSENIDSITTIIESFPNECRNKIQISIQPIWQEVDKLKDFSFKVTQITKSFHDAGFEVPSFTSIPQTPNLCYVENMLHYTIIPGLEVYKCTARDFKKTSRNYIGDITLDGKFISNNNILRYYCNSFFENGKCMECEMLPVCRGNCIQKCVENNSLECQKEELSKGVDAILEGMIRRRLKK